jgi:hypothetical protein
MSEICVCIHCHSFLKGKGKYCSDCDTAEKRRLMDESNKKLFAEKGLPFECHECDRKQKNYA